MFGHQNSDNDSTHDSTNPAQPGSFPAIPAPQDDGSAQFNPALPGSSTSWNDATTPSPTASSDDNSAAQVTPNVDRVSDHSSDELLSIKQQALSQLSPLVSHLEQTPEEKFRTTMMMIQATDNQELVKDAYTAAQAIPDEKSRAQALLDIVNEINYFTQNHTV